MLWHFLCGKSKGFSILKFSQETSQNPFLSTPPPSKKLVLGKWQALPLHNQLPT